MRAGHRPSGIHSSQPVVLSPVSPMTGVVTGMVTRLCPWLSTADTGYVTSCTHLATPDFTRGQRLATNRKERAMKLYVDTNGKQVTVTKDPGAKNDGQTDRQK